jgi:hypothetical protein
MIKYLNKTRANIKIKKNDLFFFVFIVLFVTLLLFVGADLLGILSLIFVTLIIFYFSRYYKSLATILYVALCVRLVTIFFGNFLVILPDSWGDATFFELRAWEFSQDGFFGVLSYFPRDKSSFYISWILALFYSLTDRSIIMGQSFSLLFGMGSVLLGSRLAHKIWSEKASIKVGWILALYPTLVLYSCLILREAYVWFFLLVAIYGIVCWSKGEGFKGIIITFIGFSAATFFHGGMFIGIFVFFAILIITNFIKILKRISYLKIPINSLAVLGFSIITIIYLVLISDSIPKIGSLKNMINFERLLIEISNRNKNIAGFPNWTIPKTEFELIYKAPIRVIYFIFSPFLWDIKKIVHTLGLFDGMFHIMLFILFIKNFKSIWSDQTLRIILIILASYLIFYGLATGNFGTGLRHRTKFIIISILMVAPWIPRLVFFDKKQRNINNKKFDL